MKNKIKSFNLYPSRKIANKYEVVSKLGSGWEGEVYKIRELSSDIERAAKLFYPHRNPKNRVTKQYARKLHKLRNCSLIIQYHTEEKIVFKKTEITVLISEFIEGDLLSNFLYKFPEHRLQPFQAVHLIYALASGLEEVHEHNEYHGDLHLENVIVQRYGLGFDIRLVDMYHWGSNQREYQKEDIVDLIRIFYDVLGGKKHYLSQPKPIKEIICGLRKTSILKRFPTVAKLRMHLENMEWE